MEINKCCFSPLNQHSQLADFWQLICPEVNVLKLVYIGKNRRAMEEA